MAARKVFLDTNGWVALLNTPESLHRTGGTVWRDLIREQCGVIFTDWVVAETGNGLARTIARERFSRSLEQMLRSPRVKLVFVDAAIMERALRLYTERSDKTWGLVDCASFIVMSDEGSTEAFTADRHFEQAGYTCLLPVFGA